jgi:hypothetical protein
MCKLAGLWPTPVLRHSLLNQEDYRFESQLEKKVVPFFVPFEEKREKNEREKKSLSPSFFSPFGNIFDMSSKFPIILGQSALIF